MPAHVRMAVRNLRRNRTRTVITASAISLSFALLLLSFGTADATYEQMLDQAVRAAGGSVLVHARGYWSTRGSELVIDDPGQVQVAAAAIPGVRRVAPRVIVNGLASSPSSSAAVRLAGIDPAAEAAIQDLSRHLVDGRFLPGDDPRGVVLSAKLAKRLDVQLGDRVVLTFTDPAGEMARALFRLEGVLGSGGGAVDDEAAYTTLEAARRAVGRPAVATQLGLVLEDDADRREVAAALRRALGSAAGELEILTWDEAMPELVGLIKSDKAFSYLFGIVIFVIVGFGIANTFLMAVMERIRELGLLSALGVTPLGIARLILAETAALAAVSIAAGLVLALAGHAYLSVHGIDIAAISGTKFEAGGVVLEELKIRSVIDPVRWAGAAAGVLAVVLVSALYPAWRATRLDPVEAMRTYE